MRCTRTSPVPLAIAGFPVLTMTVACTAGGSPYSSSSGAAGPMVMPQAGTAQPGLFADRAFDLGPMVVNEMGMTIYRYDKDSANPPRSNCDGTCAQKWNPIRP